MTYWHMKEAAQAAQELKVDLRTGLSMAEAARRLTEHSPYKIAVARRTSPWEILVEQFKNVLVLILLIATALAAVLGHGVEVEAIVIAVTVPARDLVPGNVILLRAGDKIPTDARVIE